MAVAGWRRRFAETRISVCVNLPADGEQTQRAERRRQVLIVACDAGASLQNDSASGGGGQVNPADWPQPPTARASPRPYSAPLPSTIDGEILSASRSAASCATRALKFH